MVTILKGTKPMWTIIGEKIRMLRKRLGLTKKQLSEEARISAYYVNKLEDGMSIPSINTVVKLAKAMGVSIEYFGRDILADTDIVNLSNTPVSKLNLNHLSPAKKSRVSDWDLSSPVLGYSKDQVLLDIIETRDWTVKLTGENIVCLARLILKQLGAQKSFETIVALTPRAGILAGALSTVLYERKKIQKTTILAPTMGDDLSFIQQQLQPGLRVLLLDEITRQADTFIKTIDEIKHQGSQITAGITVLDLLSPSEHERMLDALPSYACIFSSESIASVLEINKG